MTTTRRNFLGLTAAGSLAAIAGGLEACGPGYHVQVMRQAMPNPLVGAHAYAVLPVSWQGFTYNGMPEASWLATRTPLQQSNWMNDKQAFTEGLVQRLTIERRRDESYDLLTSAPPPGVFVIAVNVGAYNRGMFDWTLQVRTAANEIVDEVIPDPRGGGWGLALQLLSLRVAMAVDIGRYLRSRSRIA